MNDLLKKVFAWMSFGLLITFLTGYIVSVNPNMIETIYSSSILLLLLLFIEFGLVVFLSAGIRNMSPTTARISFLIYSFVTGLTFSSIFITYEMSSIIFVFLLTSVLFGILSLIGYTTNIDLSRFGTYLFIGLILVIIASIITIFIPSVILIVIISTFSAAVFLMFTAYDVQKIVYMENTMNEDNLAIYGALQLYLDFINIFIDLLRLFGSRRD